MLQQHNCLTIELPPEVDVEGLFCSVLFMPFFAIHLLFIIHWLYGAYCCMATKKNVYKNYRNISHIALIHFFLRRYCIDSYRKTKAIWIDLFFESRHGYQSIAIRQDPNYCQQIVRECCSGCDRRIGSAREVINRIVILWFEAVFPLHFSALTFSYQWLLCSSLFFIPVILEDSFISHH